jgi:site-specific DNA-methyltransferase (adenine-specific)
MELNKIYNCDCLEGLKKLESNSIPLTVTSCPYDDIRSYQGTCNWNFEIFKPIAEELYRVTKPGGIVVWVVGDAVVDGSETGSSFKQALYFKEIGFKLHDTMIYEKNSSSFPARLTSKRYTQIFEYMFVFVKGKIRNDITLIADKRNKWAGWTNWGQKSQYDTEGNLNKVSNIKPIPEFSLRNNIWKYNVSFNDKIVKHPAVFPEQLAEDCILSWSVEGDTVLDPFMGSGTTAKMALLNKRNYIGFELNEEYYNGILKRLEKFKNSPSKTVELSEIELDGETATCQVTNPETEKDIEEKTKLFNKLVDELNTYFNEQSLGILKNLTLTFKSSANDKRVQKVLEEKNII